MAGEQPAQACDIASSNTYSTEAETLLNCERAVPFGWLKTPSTLFCSVGMKETTASAPAIERWLGGHYRRITASGADCEKPFGVGTIQSNPCEMDGTVGIRCIFRGHVHESESKRHHKRIRI